MYLQLPESVIGGVQKKFSNNDVAASVANRGVQNNIRFIYYSTPT